MEIGILSSLVSPLITLLSRRVVLDVQYDVVWENNSNAEEDSSQKLRVRVINTGGSSVTLEPLRVFLPSRPLGASTFVSWKKVSDSSPTRELRLKRRERAESEVDLGKVYSSSDRPIRFTVRTQCGQEIDRTVQRDVEHEPAVINALDIGNFLNTPFIEALFYDTEQDEVRRSLVRVLPEDITGNNLGEQIQEGYENKQKPEKFLSILKELNDQKKLIWLRGDEPNHIFCFLYGYGEITLSYTAARFTSRRKEDQSTYISAPDWTVRQIMGSIVGGSYRSLTTADITLSDYRRLVASIDCYHDSKWKRILEGGSVRRKYN